MKKILLLIVFIPGISFAQQNLPAIAINKDINALKKKEQERIPVFTISGIANLNQETLKGFNAGGKASVVVRPNIKVPQPYLKTNGSKKAKARREKNHNDDLSKGVERLHAIAFYASFNKSASNNDSIVHPKIIFPELGTSSFIGTFQWENYKFYKNGNTHSRSVFFEMGLKSVQTDSTEKGQKIFFDALNYTVGLKYAFSYQRPNPFEKDKMINMGFYLAPFISSYNIPDEDREDYKKIMTKSATITGNIEELADFVVNVGVKTGFHLNGMEFFADLRHVLGKEKIPIRELRGFHANIGFVFNADLLNFY